MEARRKRILEILSTGNRLTITEIGKLIAEQEGVEKGTLHYRNLPGSISSLLLLMKKADLVDREFGQGPKGGMVYYIKVSHL